MFRKPVARQISDWVVLLVSVFLLDSACIVSNASAKVEETLAYEYYPIHVPFGADWATVLNAHALMRSANNEPLAGYTTTDINWHFDFENNTEDLCHITGLLVIITAKIQLPDVITDEQNKLLQFKRYLNALHTHELGHLENGRRAAKKIDEQISSLNGMKDCNALEGEANRLGYEILNELDRENLLHDNAEEYQRIRNAGFETTK